MPHVKSNANTLPYEKNSVEEEKILSNIASFDWNFRGAITNDITHGYHPYPARFIPQIPASLIQHFTNVGDIVYDPFVGCGTTCVEANIARRNAIGNDVNEIAVLISKVKTTPLYKKDELKILKTATNARNLVDSQYNIESDDIPELSREWFEEFIAREICIVKKSVNELTSCELQNFCFAALSAILVGISKQDSDTRYVRVSKKLSNFEAISRYEKQLSKMLRIMDYSRLALSRGTSDIRVADSRDEGIFQDDLADLIVTSPPYPNAYDYHLYHRHRLLWLGMDPAKLKKHEIGAHAHYSRTNGMDENDFYNDMEKVFRSSGRVLKSKRYFVIVIGDSTLQGRRIRNSEIIKDAAIVSGFRPVSEFKRKIDSRKKYFNPSHGNIKDEDIVIFKNCKY